MTPAEQARAMGRATGDEAMKVYLLVGYDGYEESSVLAVYEDEDDAIAAKKACAEHVSKEPRYPGETTPEYDANYMAWRGSEPVQRCSMWAEFNVSTYDVIERTKP